ncbi:tubulin folding cofactor E like protein mlt [Musca autumnalis]|uniref:tubulin folding cofactor E like protein mlt n=1 Tax=Musca autumnalis TaxID=221902 RepID=UPI003CF7CA57
MPSLLEAIERKYFSDCDDNGEEEDKDVDAAASAGTGANRLVSIFIPRLPPLQCVPELLVLNDCDIDCAGDFESIKDKCRRVRELDLAQNKLQDWHEVFQIVEHMPRIEFLNLSKNNLSNPLTKLSAPPITNLRGIVLNGTYLNWESIDVLLKNLPVLEELHLSLNDYKEVLIDTADIAASTDLDNSDKCKCCDAKESSHTNKYKKISPHKALRTLHFTGNPVEQWPEICRLGRIFPCMENLVLADCPIRAIEFPEKQDNSTISDAVDDDGLPQKHFPNLLFLNLSYASINTWDDIDRLATFPKLKNLRVKNWPLWDRLECTEHERRQLLIARLPNVAILNGGGVITPDEREDAERAFIRYYMDKPESERPKRYLDLVAKHGKLDPLVNISLKPDKRVKIILTYGDKSESRHVDLYRTVADLKVKLEKIIPLPANKMRLYYLDQDYREFGPEEMRYPNKLLYSYNIQAGDEIIVDEKK